MVPVILITGFLGSGKTTFVNYLLQKFPDYKFSVILNEFGDIKLESQFIKSHKKDIIELANGCMCCVAKSDVPRVIDLILEKSPKTQYLLIEASGLSDPDPVHESFNNPRISRKVFLSKTVCIVDALNFLETKDIHRTIMAQLADSDIAIISKVDEGGREKGELVQSMIKNMMPLTEVVLFDKEFDPKILFSDKPSISTKSNNEDHHHIHEEFQEDWLVMDRPLSLNEVQDAFQKVPEEVHRAKGIVLIKNDKKVLIQYVAGRLELIPSTWLQDEEHKTQILFIGKDFSHEDIVNVFLR